jgi:hypothetical protein
MPFLMCAHVTTTGCRGLTLCAVIVNVAFSDALWRLRFFATVNVLMSIPVTLHRYSDRINYCINIISPFASNFQKFTRLWMCKSKERSRTLYFHHSEYFMLTVLVFQLATLSVNTIIASTANRSVWQWRTGHHSSRAKWVTSTHMRPTAPFATKTPNSLALRSTLSLRNKELNVTITSSRASVQTHRRFRLQAEDWTNLQRFST